MGRDASSPPNLSRRWKALPGGCLFLLSVSLMGLERSSTDIEQKEQKSALQLQFKASVPNHLLCSPYPLNLISQKKPENSHACSQKLT